MKTDLKHLETAYVVSDQQIELNGSQQLFDTLLDQIGEINTIDRLHEKIILEKACIELMNSEIRITNGDNPQ